MFLGFGYWGVAARVLVELLRWRKDSGKDSSKDRGVAARVVVESLE